MIINHISIANLYELISADREKETSHVLDAGLGIKSGQIYDKLNLTLQMSEVNILELLYLKKICDVVRYGSPLLVSEEQIRAYNLEEELVDSLQELSNFIHFVGEKENLETSCLYQTVMETVFDVTCIIKGEKLESMFGSQLMSCYRVIADKETGKRRILTDEELSNDLGKFYDKFCNFFFSSVHNGMRSEYEEIDSVVDKHMITEYYNNNETTSAKLVRVNGPFGASMHCVPKFSGDDGDIPAFQKKLPTIVENELQSQIDMYFVCNSSFWTYAHLLLDWDMTADCCMSRELTLTDTLYVDDVILQGYTRRYEKFVSPLLSQRKFLLERTSGREEERPSTTYMMMFAPFNLSITYLLKVKYVDWMRIENYLKDHDPLDDIGDKGEILQSIYEKGKVVINQIHKCEEELRSSTESVTKEELSVEEE